MLGDCAKHTDLRSLSTVERSYLESEARLILNSLGATPNDENLINLYIQAHQHYNFIRPPPEFLRLQLVIKQAVASKSDLESLEFFLRLKVGDNPLTKKYNILFYLLEADPIFQQEFVKNKPDLMMAWLALCLQVARSLVKATRGFYIYRKLERGLQDA